LSSGCINGLTQSLLFAKFLQVQSEQIQGEILSVTRPAPACRSLLPAMSHVQLIKNGLAQRLAASTVNWFSFLLLRYFKGLQENLNGALLLHALIQEVSKAMT
jgi:hypothetical protein